MTATRPRTSLALAGGALVVATAAALAAVDAVAHDGRTAVVVVLLVASAVPLAGAALPGRAVHRWFRHLYPAALAGTATAVAVLAGTAVLVLAHGRLPRAAERPLVWSAAAGLLAAALVGAVVATYASQLLRRARSGMRRTPDDVLRALAEGGEGTSGDDLLQQLVDSVRRAFELDFAEVWIGDGRVLQRAAASPASLPGPTTLTDAEIAVLSRADVAGEGWLRLWLPRLLEGRESAQLRLSPARHEGEVLGLLTAGRSAGSPAFDEGDDRSFGDLGRRLGILLSNRALGSLLRATLEDLRSANADLRRSRARLASAGDAERRRIERNLHDGAQQHLVALAVTLGLARDLVTEDPAGAVDLLEEAVTEVKATVQQVRDLAHGIYPPLLVEAGLGQALSAAAGRAAQPVVVSARGVGRHPGPVEEAVYFCCLEALQNAAKHAPGSRVTLTLFEDADRLGFEVADEGPGFEPASVVPGHGFANVADRLGAIGGRVTWTSAPGAGTTVRGEVPLPVPQEA
ncbi:histidine kinase/DNA gyrase B/HSP90-like ATPase [Motilibacter peucedani]|uniref:histidine kinase n=1 Tax=Motilibacter peucedani TaxID=598650 RepID=A0A420XV46_9ACTN|nr:histidine kinase [Motilibacter peucedani]RKS80529.1 histidine kinase/DNA gyrase B/HSP90-like ATPase [Motilibacter peucedani]